MPTSDYLALECLQHERELPARLKDRLPGLVNVGAVEVLGRGKGARYILSAALYAALGAKGTHTRKKGLDHETNKALLVRHLKEQGNSGAPLAEFKQVLPALPTKSVQALLDELRSEGRVAVVGQRRWARWYLVNSAVFDPKGI